MRAMILAAGLGSRLRPLTQHRAKPALPIRGRAVVSLLLDFLGRHGIDEVMINLHYLPESIQNAVENDCPEQTTITWSIESEPLGTGGGILKAVEFLERDEHCVVLAGDMLLDFDLANRFDRHVRSGRDVTLLLRDDPRGADFGTIGLDAGGRVTRIGSERCAGANEEMQSGLFTGVRFFSRSAFDHWPEKSSLGGDSTDPLVFEDLRDWLMPAMARGLLSLGGDCLDSAGSVWEPVGTPTEYLAVNLDPPSLPSLGGAASNWQGDIRILGPKQDVVLGAAAVVGSDCQLARAVVWDHETVPSGLVASDGVFAANAFHSVAGHSSSTSAFPPRNAIVETAHPDTRQGH